MKKFAYFLSMIALTIVFTTACGNRTSNTVDSSEISDFYKQKGWFTVNNDQQRVFINSDNYHMINNIPIVLVFAVTTHVHTMAYLRLADASKTENPRDPSFNEKMTIVSLMLDGENILINTERPIDNVVNLADYQDAIDLLRRLQVTKKATFQVELNNGEMLTYTFSPYVDKTK